MHPTRLRTSIAIAQAVPGGALRLCMAGGGAMFASDHPAGEITIDELRDELLVDGVDGNTHLDDLISDVEVAGSLVSLGAGLFLHDDGGPELWFAVPLSPVEIQAALGAVECPPAPAHLEVTLRPEYALGVTSVRVASVLDMEADVADDELCELALHIMGACLAAELDLGIGQRPRR
jgi:hypothetical protein